ncbi:hypothetical protein AURDEDRAFT_170656 [Auricularia subglabra TFB-10046 SS5]|nr:hypothetical protein AURDEDRAFT_170656 [Auricularia subglabra TFB-10046 SS5]
MSTTETSARVPAAGVAMIFVSISILPSVQALLASSTGAGGLALSTLVLATLSHACALAGFAVAAYVLAAVLVVRQNNAVRLGLCLTMCTVLCVASATLYVLATCVAYYTVVPATLILIGAVALFVKYQV